MQKKDEALKWLPLWIEKWLWGSTRFELTIEQRAVWIDLLAIAGKDGGFIRANASFPYPPSQLAGMLIVPQDILESTIQRCLETGKLTLQPDGTLYVTNWEEYNFTDRHQRRMIQKKLEAEAEKEWLGPEVRISDQQVRKEDALIISYNIVSSKDEEGGPGGSAALSAGQEAAIRKEARQLLPEKDVELRILPAINKLQDEFKLKDPVEAFKKKAAWWRDKPASLRGNLSLQLRNWWRIEAEMTAKDQAPLQVGRNIKPNDQKAILYKDARKARVIEILTRRKADLDKAQENGDQPALEQINAEIKDELAAFSREWHDQHGEAQE